MPPMRGMVVGLVLAIASSSIARAEVRNELVVVGIKAYDELDYQKASELLGRALAEPLSDEERLAAYSRLVYCHAAFDDDQLMRDDFAALLKLDPDFKLDHTASPKMRALYEEAKAKRAAETKPIEKPIEQPIEPKPVEKPIVKQPAPLTPETDARANSGEPFRVRAFVAGATEVQLYHRARGASSYSKVTAEGHLDRFEATIPGLFVDAPAIEYYVVAVDDTGAAVAAAGSPDAPLSIAVAERKPLYARPVVWIVAGAVVLVGIVAAIIGASASHAGGESTATIMVITH